MASKRRRTEITPQQKQEICVYAQENPVATQNQIASHFNAKWDSTIKRNTIADILHGKQKWMANTEQALHAFRNRGPKFSQLEECLFTWFTQVRQQNGIITDDVLKEKAKKFGTDLGISEKEFSYSEGWLRNFKIRYGIKRHTIVGESEGADMRAVANGRVQLQKILENYSPEDIFNFDETGLFFRLQPNKTLSTQAVRGVKKAKDRVTIGLCANATGKIKIKPIVIAKSARPRCFGKKFDPNNLVHYRNNSSAWMRTVEFQEFLSLLNREMIRKNKKILLLVDNCPSHIVPEPEPSNVQVHFLPPNTTSHIQPMDAGIIHNFKAYYRKQLVQYYIHCIDESKPQTIDIKQALYFITGAWKEVAQSTIAGCWNRTGLYLYKY